MWKTSSHTGMDGNHGHKKITQRPRIRQIERLATTCLLVPRKSSFTFFVFLECMHSVFYYFFIFFHTSCPKLHCTKNREALLNVTGTTSKGKLSIITLETRLNTSKIHRNLARISESGGDLDEQTAQRHIDITA